MENVAHMVIRMKVKEPKHTVFENHRKSLIQHNDPKRTVLPDRSHSKGQKSVETVKIRKCDILSNFQTIWNGSSL